MNNFGYHPPIRPRDPFQGRGHEGHPMEPIQGEALSPQNQTPKLQINVRFEKDAPETPIIEPTIQSVRALANWYRENGVTTKHIPISGARIGNTEIPPLFSQEQDFDETAFRAWATSILGGPSAVTMDRNPQPGANWNNIELDILRKVYGNLPRIEAVRHLKEEKDIKTGAIKNLNKMRLDKKLEEVLDEKFGDPMEFREDILTINTMIDDEKEHGYLSAEAIDYAFGCVIHNHIMRQGFTIKLENNQPVVETGDATLDAQWKSTLTTLHFGRKTGVPGVESDNQAKIADYIAAYTYHNIDKNLTGYFTTLSQKAIGTNPDTTLTEDIIKNSTLTNEEKTFLSQWLGKEEKLGDIQTRQRDYVERARENTRGKSWETIKKDFAKAPLSTMMQISPMAGLAVGAVIIYGLVRMMVGEGKLSKFFGATAAIIGGIAIVGNIKNAEKLWGELAGENFANGTTQAPRPTQNIGEDIRNIGDDIGSAFEKKWERFTSLFTSSNDWSELMLDERVGPKLIDKYPTGAILAVLNPDPDSKFNNDGKWSGTVTQESEIKEILGKLTEDEKRTLNSMLQETWTKYREANETTLTDMQLQKGKMRDMVDDLDTKYSWFNKVWRPAYWFDEASKEETFVEFTKNPNGWKNAKIGDLMVEWFSGSDREDIPVGRTVPQSIDTLVANIHGDRLESVQKSIQKIWEENAPCDPDKTLGELLTKED